MLHFHHFARIAVLGVALAALTCAAQSNPTEPAVTADPQLAEALSQVSAQRIQANIEKLVGFGTRLTLSAQDAPSIAAGHGIGAAREWIKSEFERYSKDCGGCLEVKTDAFTEGPADRISKATEITNVYAVLKGTDAENAKRVVLVTGHYDSRNSDTFDVSGDAPGANDDGSGTAVSLECARVLSELKFPGTIVFLAVAGEEQGLNGSHHFAKMAKDQGWDLQAVLNNDIVGGDKSADQDHTVVRVFSEGVPAAANEQDLRRIRGLGGETDSPSRQVARLNAATLASLAAAPAPPTNVHILTKDLVNDSTLTWDASPGTSTAEYEVIWRATTSPEWEHAQGVGSATRVTMKFSKDNVIFAVRSVGNKGHRSLPVVPVPER